MNYYRTWSCTHVHVTLFIGEILAYSKVRCVILAVKQLHVDFICWSACRSSGSTQRCSLLAKMELDVLLATIICREILCAYHHAEQPGAALWEQEGRHFLPSLCLNRAQTLTATHRSPLNSLICLNPSSEGQNISVCDWQADGGVGGGGGGGG